MENPAIVNFENHLIPYISSSPFNTGGEEDSLTPREIESFLKLQGYSRQESLRIH